jgi:hypothetical protein
MKQVLDGEKGEHWQIIDDLITTHGKVYVPPESLTLAGLLAHAHDCGHEGTEKTLHQLHADFHVPGARALVRDFVCTCTTYQRNKTDQLQPAGLLQPLPVPSTVWVDIRIDFIEGLPKVNGHLVILTVVDRFSKSAHFLLLGHPYTTTTSSSSTACPAPSLVTATQRSQTAFGRNSSSSPASIYSSHRPFTHSPMGSRK